MALMSHSKVTYQKEPQRLIANFVGYEFIEHSFSDSFILVKAVISGKH